MTQHSSITKALVEERIAELRNDAGPRRRAAARIEAPRSQRPAGPRTGRALAALGRRRSDSRRLSGSTLGTAARRGRAA